jgi:hypothetical protein
MFGLFKTETNAVANQNGMLVEIEKRFNSHLGLFNDSVGSPWKDIFGNVQTKI